MFSIRSVSGRVVALVATAGFVLACGDGDGGAAASARAGAASAKRAMSEPATAALTKENGAGAHATSSKQRSAGGFNPLGGGGATSTPGVGTRALALRSIHLLSDEPATDCPDIEAGKDEGTCPCEGSGDVSYAISDLEAVKAQKLEGELTMSFVFRDCRLGDSTLDGRMTMIQSKDPIVDKSTWTGGKSAKAPKASSSSFGPNLLWSAEGLRSGGETLDFSMLVQDGETCLRPPVDGGFYYVCLGDGVRVYAENGVFECDFAKGACVDESGKELEMSPR
ncbi:MAG: hypothetical protein KIT84_10020 [Labilithrix sp.]|nr:hypothetical protein [Labilithrix sp.]MCW5811339.1 hypothetical protein [Labilithrix sp.]